MTTSEGQGSQLDHLSDGLWKSEYQVRYFESYSSIRSPKRKFQKFIIILAEYNMSLINYILLGIKLAELNNKINVLILSDHDDIEYNYAINIFNNPYTYTHSN